MTDEAAARAEIARIADVSRETSARLETFTQMVASENETQNLVSGASLPHIWTRHIFDSAQLLRFAPVAGNWVDLGAGPGFPGIVLAILQPGSVMLIEERRRRCDFLARAVAALGLTNVEIACARAERVLPRPCAYITARAFAPLPKLLQLGAPFAHSGTKWVLPKGRSAQSELESALSTWQGDFRLEPSLTDADARIIIAEGVRPIGAGKKKT